LVALLAVRVFGRRVDETFRAEAACVSALDCIPGAGSPNASDERDGPVTGAAQQDAVTGSPPASSNANEPPERSAVGRLPGRGLPKSAAAVVNRLWLDPRIDTYGESMLPWSTRRTEIISDKLQGYSRRWDAVHDLYDRTFSRSDAADAEHFYFAAQTAAVFPVVGPIVSAIVSVGWDGAVQPATRLVQAVIGRVPPRTAARQVLNDWRQVYIDLAGAWWGAWKRPDPGPPR
jgi:hypothetical protein